MKLETEVTKNIIIKLLKKDENYRTEIVELLDAIFLDDVIAFFKKIVEAKFKNQLLDIDWYKKEFIDAKGLEKKDIALNSGLNVKTISNIYNAATKEIVIDASCNHYENLCSLISKLIDHEQENLKVKLTIKYKEISVDLNINESILVINALAVRRAALRGGVWSTAGKQVEKPLMITLCKLFEVPDKNYSIKVFDESIREIDFYLINEKGNQKAEVKLMGKGNPESADVIHARETKVFVADKLSELNITQFDSANVEWVELNAADGYKRFTQVLKNLGIPHKEFNGDLEKRLKEIFSEIFIQNSTQEKLG